MDARATPLGIVTDGPYSDIFLALQSRRLFATIGEHAHAVDASSFAPSFAALQSYASDSFILAVTRLLERERGAYALQSVHGALRFLQAHANEIPIREPVFLEQSMRRLGNWSGSVSTSSGAEQTVAAADVLLGRLPHYSENDALRALKALRDKRIAHPERLRVESLPVTTWENAESLLKIPIEALAVCGAYLAMGYVDNTGALFMESDVQLAANATRRLLREVGIEAMSRGA